jgi:hypothetical protein
MEAWLNREYIRRHCEELRAAAARDRLARCADRPARRSARRRIGRALLAFGFFFVNAGELVGGKEDLSGGVCA